MDLGHLHLMLNHLPVLGVPALLALLLWGLARGMPAVTRGALWLTVVLAVVTAGVVALWGTVIVVVTGLLAAASSARWTRCWLTRNAWSDGGNRRSGGSTTSSWC